MAVIKPSLDKVLEFEGGYVNDPTDKGGETIFGVSRKNNPTSKIWFVLDALKKTNPKSPKIWESEIKSKHFDLIAEMYTKNYWDAIRLSEISNQHLADLLFDIAVNMGTSKSGKELQKALNFVKKLSLIVDGVIGNKTLATVNSLVEVDIKQVINTIVDNRVKFYQSLVEKTPSQAKYLKGWTRRAMSFFIA